MTYQPKLATTINNEDFYLIPYDDIFGYAISKEGNVISNKSGSWKTHKTTYSEKTKYFNVTFTTNKPKNDYGRTKKQDTYTIHKLLYSTFVSGRNHSFNDTVDHINNDRSDNRIENLQLLSRKENIQKGQKLIGRVAIDDSTAIAIADSYRNGIRPVDIAITFNLKNSAVNKIIYGYSQSSITGIPKRVHYRSKAPFKAEITRINKYAQIFENHFDRYFAKARLKRHQATLKAIASLSKPASFTFYQTPQENQFKESVVRELSGITPSAFLSNNKDFYYPFSEASCIYSQTHHVCKPYAVRILLGLIANNSINAVLIGKRYFIAKEEVA